MILTRRRVFGKKKITCGLVEFAVPVGHRVEIKENETIDKYLDLTRELKSCETQY